MIFCVKVHEYLPMKVSHSRTILESRWSGGLIASGQAEVSYTLISLHHNSLY